MDALPLIILVLAVAGIALRFWWSNHHRKQPSELEAYYEHLCGEFNAIPERKGEALYDQYEKHVQGIHKRHKDRSLDWDDLFQFELLLLKLMPEEKLRRKVWLIRKRWQSTASPKTAQLYAESLEKEPGLKDPDHALPDELLADTEVLLQDLFWRYRMKTAWEEQRGRFSDTGWAYLTIFLLAAGSLVEAARLFSLPGPSNTALIIASVAFTGAVGGFLSMLRRLQLLSNEGRRENQLLALESSRTSIVLQAMLSGAVFGLVLSLMFIGGLLAGKLFPEGLTSPLSMLTLDNLAKLLIWAFIAGFAERLVPDLLDQFALKAKGEVQETREAAPQPLGEKAPA